MKINEVTEARPGYADNPQHKKIADLGRKLMDMSANMKITKSTTDEEIAKSNKMASFGDALTRFGTAFGPKSMSDLMKTARISAEEAKEFLELAQKAPAVKLKGDEVEPEDPEADDEFNNDDDEAMAAKADAAARGK